MPPRESQKPDMEFADHEAQTAEEPEVFNCARVMELAAVY